MKESTDRIASLLEKSLRQELTPEESMELESWLSKGDENKELRQQLTNQDQLLERLRIYDLANKEAILQKTMSRINEGGKVVQLPKRKIAWVKYAAAAAVIVAVSGTVYFINKVPVNEQTASAEKQDKVIPVLDNIVPGGKHAVVTLADGSTIKLDGTPDGELTKQGDLSLTKTEGHITYSGRFNTSGPVSTGSEKHASLHNMVSTPRGGQYQITLPDGSKVWLNAASSLRFPLAFAGDQRVVEVTGEAYFEVTSIPLTGSATGKMPFIVKANDCEVEVLGTHFNVKAYKDEDVIKTTLLEGSVRVRNGNARKILTPGQQAHSQNGELRVVKADGEEETGWKDGMLYMTGSTESIMNQIARWYDVKVVYEGKAPEYTRSQNGLNANIPLKQTFEDLRETLKLQNIHTRLDKRTLFVRQ